METEIWLDRSVHCKHISDAGLIFFTTAAKEAKTRAFRSVVGLEAKDRKYFLFSLELDRLVGPACSPPLLAHE
jgi:hypothetical protein